LDILKIPFSLKRSSHVATISNATKDSIVREFNYNPKKISIVYNGVSPKKHIPQQHTKITAPYILFVGTLEPRKNLEGLLTAYAQLDTHIRDDAHLVIAGGKGWGDVNLTHIIEQLNLKSHVHLMGYVTEEELDSLYANALFLAMPSLYEGFGLPIIEAMSHGRCVLTSKNSSMPEAAGKAGHLIDPFNIDSIKQGLLTMITNEAIRHDLESHAKKHAAHFSWGESAQKLRTVFESVLSNHKKK
jgi:glycosyltransferase involved in cell wall biosynthesis